MPMMISQKFYLFVACSLVIWNSTIQDSPILNINFFEGDILGVDSDQILQLISEKNFLTGIAQDDLLEYGGATGDPDMLWPNGKVYYDISIAFDSTSISIIESAFEAFHNNTCIKLIKRNNETDYIKFMLDFDKCASFLGRKGGAQKLFLSRNCLNGTGHIIHEIMHAIGFYHEHSRWDRDDYVTIVYDNLKDEKMKYNFWSYGLGKLQNLQTPYDYESIMHYPSNAFAKDGKHTIERKNSTAALVQTERLSAIDVQEINLLYKCTKYNSPVALSQTVNNIRDKDNICWGTRFVHDYESVRAINPLDCIKQCMTSIKCGAIAFERGVIELEENCYFYDAPSNYTLIVDLNWKWGTWKKDPLSIECMHPKPLFRQDGQQKSEYQINVKTSNIYGAGTDANVFIELVDTSGRLETVALKYSLQNYNKFERNSVEQFKFRKASYTELLYINVRHDNSGVYPPWHLEYIEVLDNDIKYRFQCNCWFSETHDDKKISRNLHPAMISDLSKVCWGIRFRNHFLNVHAQTVNDCIFKCNKNYQCEAISFNNDQFSRYNCLFFNKSLTNYTSQLDLNLQWGVWKKGPNFQCKYKSKIQWGLRFLSYYKSLYVEQPNFCVKLCKVEITCDAITFNVANTYPDENCYFINIEDKEKNDTFAPMQWGSWEKNTTWAQPTYSKNVIKWGMRFTNHFEVFKALNPVDCKLRCKVDVRCYAMSFHICKRPCPKNCYFYIINEYETVYEPSSLEWASWQKH